MLADQMIGTCFKPLLAGAVVAVCCGCADPGEPSGDLYTRVVEGNVFDTVPVRGEFQPLRNRRTGFEYKCSECHEDFTSLKRERDLPGEHAAIYDAFNHGLNNNCLNCHNPKDRNAYIDHDGTSIPASEPARLCAKCHGPTFHDWERGIHGRQNGFWDASKGASTKLLCVQCHDPHSPSFPDMVPDPAPVYSRFAQKPPSPKPDSPHGVLGDVH